MPGCTPRRVLVALACAVLACSAGNGSAPDDAGSISAATLAERIAEGAPPLLLDVRTPAEFASGHVPGATNIPYDELAQRLGELAAPAGSEIVVYCERGGRARAAERVLEDSGYTHVRLLEGHMSGWRQAGLPCQGC